MPRKVTGRAKGRPTTIRDQFVALDPEETIFRCKFDGSKVKVGSLSAHTKTVKHKAAQELQPKDEPEPVEEPEEEIKEEEVKIKKPKKPKKEEKPKEPEKPKKEEKSKEPEKPKKVKKEPPEHVEGKVTSSVYICPDGAKVNLKSIKLHFESEMHKKYEKKNNVIIDYPTEQIKEKREQKTKLKTEEKEKHAKIVQKLRHTIKFTEEKPEAKEKEEIPDLPPAPEWREIEGEDRGDRGNRYYDYEIARARYMDKKEEVEKLQRRQEEKEQIFIPPTLQGIIDQGKEITIDDIKTETPSITFPPVNHSKSLKIKGFKTSIKVPLTKQQTKFLIKETKTIYGMLEDALITGIEDYVVNAERNEEIDDTKVHGLKKKKLLEDVYLETFPLLDMTKLLDVFDDSFSNSSKKEKYKSIIDKSILQDKSDKSSFVAILHTILLYIDTIIEMNLIPLHERVHGVSTLLETSRNLRVIEFQAKEIFRKYILKTFVTTVRQVRKYLLFNLPDPVGTEVKQIMKQKRKEARKPIDERKPTEKEVEKIQDKQDEELDDYLKDAFKF